MDYFLSSAESQLEFLTMALSGPADHSQRGSVGAPLVGAR
jgi:hypothetical protein